MVPCWHIVLSVYPLEASLGEVHDGALSLSRGAKALRVGTAKQTGSFKCSAIFTF